MLLLLLLLMLKKFDDDEEFGRGLSLRYCYPPVHPHRRLDSDYNSPLMDVVIPTIVVVYYDSDLNTLTKIRLLMYRT
jgi:hypothetical protein